MNSPVFVELERVVRLMTEELAAFRRRALQAEGRVRELEDALAAAEARADEAAARSSRAAAQAHAVVQESLPLEDRAAPDGARLQALEQENTRLRTRLEGATERTRQLLDRVRFLRQQQEQEAPR